MKLKVIVLTQEEVFFLPANIDKLVQVADVLEIVVVNSKGSLINKTCDFYKWFGFRQFVKMGLTYCTHRVLGYLDSISGWRILHGHGTIRDVARKNRIPFLVVSDINSVAFLEHIRTLKPDLIVSYSLPQVIKRPLLSLPVRGIINVHGSLLPKYRGLLPSFWVLYHDEEFTGATVHYVSEKIDEGHIILQESVSLDGVQSMFEVMKRTKEVGGELVVKAVELISEGRVKPLKNDVSLGNYFSWPSREQTLAFRKKGYRLI